MVTVPFSPNGFPEPDEMLPPIGKEPAICLPAPLLSLRQPEELMNCQMTENVLTSNMGGRKIQQTTDQPDIDTWKNSSANYKDINSKIKG